MCAKQVLSKTRAHYIFLIVQYNYYLYIDYSECYIPMTRRTLIRQLMQQQDLLTPGEMSGFEKFSSSLDSAIIHRYHVLLQELTVRHAKKYYL